MRMMNRKGNSALHYAVIIIAVILALQFVVGVDVFSGVKMKIDDGIQIISKKGYQITENVRFEEIKATGVRFTEESWDAFLQICDRLVLSWGHLTVYADLEARVMFVYSKSSETQDAYYVTF